MEDNLKNPQESKLFLVSTAIPEVLLRVDVV
jgi:hypothetical protein